MVRHNNDLVVVVTTSAFALARQNKNNQRNHSQNGKPENEQVNRHVRVPFFSVRGKNVVCFGFVP